MARFTILHTCGHESAKDFYGPIADRQSRADWLSGRPCEDCATSERNAHAVEWAAANGLPPLKGSEKQCGWAESIRWTSLAGLPGLIAAVARKYEDPGHAAMLKSLAESPYDAGLWGVYADWLETSGNAAMAGKSPVPRAVAWVLAQDQAKYWIDSRNLFSVQNLAHARIKALGLDASSGVK